MPVDHPAPAGSEAFSDHRPRRAAVAATLALLGALCAPVAAQSPRQGEEQIRHVFTVVDRATMKMGDTTVIQRELSGLSINDKGSGMFHDMGMRCLALITSENGRPRSDGRCVLVDRDGDQVFHTFVNRAGTGHHDIIGGTGKYTGISGREDFTIPPAPRAPEGANVLVVPVKATWKLP
jgi:hypothetical protein